MIVIKLIKYGCGDHQPRLTLVEIRDYLPTYRYRVRGWVILKIWV